MEAREEKDQGGAKTAPRPAPEGGGEAEEHREQGERALAAAADGRDLSELEEQSALDFLVGDSIALTYNVDVDFDTPGGMKKLRFVIRQVDGDRIKEIEDENREGRGPMAALDEDANDAALITEATLKLVDLETERELELNERPFMPADAESVPAGLRKRFSKQSGLLTFVATRVRIVSGWDGTRVGEAQKRTARAVGNS